jgi:hypothetical protein
VQSAAGVVKPAAVRERGFVPIGAAGNAGGAGAGAEQEEGDADVEMTDVSEPVTSHVEQAALYLQQTMGVLFAPLSTPPAVAAPATNVLQQMNLPQLTSLQSYVRALDASLQLQIVKQRRSQTPASSAKPTTPPRNAAGTSPRARSNAPAGAAASSTARSRD